MTENLEYCEYGSPFGFRKTEETAWDDYEDIFKKGKEIRRNKITNIKIYYNREDDIEEKYIIGLTFTFKNLFTGETKVVDHKGSDNISGMKELVIKEGEYLTKFNIKFEGEDVERCTLISFTTNKGNNISVGSNDGQEKSVTTNGQNNIYVGTFGGLNKKIDAIGCLYIKKEHYIEENLFRFFILKYLKDKDEKFKEEIEAKYNELSNEDKFLWKAVNLPDAAFQVVIKFCFI